MQVESGTEGLSFVMNEKATARPQEIAAVFREAGFKVATGYISGLNYRCLASSKLRWLSPAYNAIDRVPFAPVFMKPLRAFVLTYGAKP